MPIAYAFFNFVFFKIMSAAMFDDPLTIWASAIMAIVVTLLTIFAIPVGLTFASEKAESDSLSNGRFTVVVLITGAVSCFASYLIALGFSDRLYRDISRWSSYRDVWEQDLFWFCIMVLIPVVVGLTITYRQFKSPL